VLATAVGVLGLAAPASVSAQTVKDALAVVPKDALGYVIVSKLAEASTKIAEVAEQMQLPMPGPPLELAKKELGISKGLNEDGAALLAVLPGPKAGGEPIAIAYVPVTDYKAFLEGLKVKGGSEDEISELQPPKGKPLVIAKKDSFAVVTEARHKGALQKALASGGGAGSAATLQPWLAKNQISGVMTHKGIKLVAMLARKGLKEQQEKTDEQGEAGKIPAMMFKGMEGFLDTIEKDVTALAAGWRVDKGGNQILGTRALFRKGGELAQAAGEIEAIKGGPLAGLPAQPYILAAGGAIPGKILARLTDFGAEFQKMIYKDVPAEKLKKLQEIQAMGNKGLRGIAVLIGTGKEGDAVFANTVIAMKVDDATAFLASQEKAVKALNELTKDGSIPTLGQGQAKRTKVGGRPALEIAWEITAADPNIAAIQKKVMEVLFGAEDKMTTTSVVMDDNTILTGYTTPAKLQELLKASGGKELEATPDVAKVIAMLPKGSQWAGFISPKGGIDAASRVLSNFVPVKLPEFAETPPVGFALKLTPTGAEGQMVLPSATLQGIARFVRNVKRLQDQ
jgi:hypothetical protein